VECRGFLAAGSEGEIREKKKDYQASKAKQTAIYLNIIKVLGDVIPAGQASEFFPNVLGISANDSACGLGGLVSALLTSYQLYE
jgi:hypothetical protein